MDLVTKQVAMNGKESLHLLPPTDGSASIVATYEGKGIDPIDALWLAVIDQAIFDAYLHSTGGNYQSIAWVKDARQYFDSSDFAWICEQLGIEVDWFRGLLRKLEALAKSMRGVEYERAVMSRKAIRRVCFDSQRRFGYVR